MFGRPLRVAVAIACTVAILVATWMPAPSGPSLFVGVDKVVHFGSFLVWAAAWRWAGLTVRWVIGLGIVMACVTEFGQGLLPWPRTPDFKDLVGDIAGVFVGVQLEPAWRWFRQRRTPPSS